MSKKKVFDQQFLHLSHDVYTIAEAAVRKRGRRLSWLRYARPTSTGWSFFKKKHIPWDVLQEIHDQVQNLHKQCCTNIDVTHTFSQLINLTHYQRMHLAA